VDTLVEFPGIRRVSQERFPEPTPRFPPLAPGGTRWPVSAVLSRRYECLSPLPPRFVALAWRYLGGTRSVRSGADECAAQAWSWSPGSSNRDVPRKRQALPSSWGTPIVRLRLFHSDAGRTAGTRPLPCRGVALGHRTAKAAAKGLSALPSMAFGLAAYASQCGLARPTQDSLPAAGQALPDGLSTRTVPLKGFWSTSYIASSLPKLSWRNRCARSRLAEWRFVRRRGGPKQVMAAFYRVVTAERKHDVLGHSLRPGSDASCRITDGRKHRGVLTQPILGTGVDSARPHNQSNAAVAAFLSPV
jgi:hypothetical protein